MTRNTPATAVHLNQTAVAALIRADLKNDFPGVKFSVRSSRYSCGSSVRVEWTDGPVDDAVTKAIGRYMAQGFDASTDSQTNSGPVQLRDGSWAKMYCYVSTRRNHSAELRARVAAWFDRRFADCYAPGFDRETALYRRLRVACLAGGHLLIARD
ncbi:MAG TPA: LPD29 domain-containing protein [Vicinamibacterales bacterium]|nr:LPD29 domain-containing protein [Vicinamibacterales bacterium]